MGENTGSSTSWLLSLAPFTAMVAVEFIVVGGSVLSKAALAQGMSIYVSVVYCNALASFLLLPFFLFNRKKTAPVTFPLLATFFFLSLIGSGGQIIYLTAVKLSSPTLASAMANLTPIFTFLLAVITRMETLDLRKPSGQAKCLGATVAVAGAFIATLYKGSAIILNQSANYNNHILNSQRAEWILAGLLLAIVCFMLATWNIVQGATVKQYPCTLNIVFICTLFTAIQSAVFSLVLETNPKAWILKSRIEVVYVVFSAVFGGVIQMGICIWCLGEKGPVYVSMFEPLCVAISAFMTVIFLGETLYLGSVMGSVIIVIGFYSVIWGQIQEQKSLPSDLTNTSPSSIRAPLLHPTNDTV